MDYIMEDPFYAQTLGARLTKLIESGIKNRLELAQLCGTSVSTVMKHIPASLKRQGNYMTCGSIGLTPSEVAVIEGGILGDGHVIQNPSGSAFEFDNKKRDLVEWVAAQLDRLVVREPDKRYTQSRSLSEFKGMTRFRTATWKDLNHYRVRWYETGETIRGRKQIPDGFQLTRLSGLLWYLGDGSLVSKSTQEMSQVVKFATHCFPLSGLKDILNADSEG